MGKSRIFVAFPKDKKTGIRRSIVYWVSLCRSIERERRSIVYWAYVDYSDVDFFGVVGGDEEEKRDGPTSSFMILPTLYGWEK